jgi:hypothetical protein
VLYAGLSLEAAVVETLLRNPSRRMVYFGFIAERASCNIKSGRDLRLVQLHSKGLLAVGCDNRISTGPYGPCGAWADALWAHADQPDGIAYRSRYDPGELCVALFDRPNLELLASESEPLDRQLPMMAAILSAYEKSIASVPG